MRRSLLGFSLGVLALALAAGCGRGTAPTTPASSRTAERAAISPFEATTMRPDDSPRGFFPLQLGDRWTYDHRLVTRVHPTDSTEAGDSTLFQAPLQYETICVEPHAGHDYVVMRAAYDSPEPYPFWISFRQDRSGLYEWDATSGPPACDTTQVGKGIGLAFNSSPDRRWSATASALHLRTGVLSWKRAWLALDAKRAAVEACGRPIGSPPGGELPGEIQRLRYPLYPGQNWDIRPDGSFHARVERPVLLRTRAGRFLAWSIRYTSLLFGPNDVVRAYYGPQGYMGLRAELYSAATDESGNIIGILEIRQSDELTAIHLEGMHRLANDPLGRPMPVAGE